MALTAAELCEMLDLAGAPGRVTFPLHDPDRHPGYRVPNDRVLAWAGASDGRLIPFCRLDPAEDPVAEAERALDAGAVGIKLHPRAQAFGAGLAPRRREHLRAGRGAAGADADPRRRGLPPEFGGELVEIVDRHPGVRLILAHLGVTDQAVMADGLRDHPSVVYDTSWMNAFEIMTLARADPGRADRVRLRSAVRAHVQRSLPAAAIAALPGVEADVRGRDLGGSVRRHARR